MQITLTGRDTAKSRVVEQQVVWLVQELKLLKSRLHLEIIPYPGMAKKCGRAGMVTRIGNKIGLAIDTSLPIHFLLKTVSHEMIHVKQLATGKLKYTNRGVAIWCGKKMNVPYLRQPWEIEAYKKQDHLTNAFIGNICQYFCFCFSSTCTCTQSSWC